MENGVDETSDSFEVIPGLVSHDSEKQHAHSSSSNSTATDVDGNGDSKQKAKDGNKDHSKQSLPLYRLFSFTDTTDILLMILGTAGALLNGATMPLVTVLLGNMTQAFGEHSDADHVVHQVSKVQVLLPCSSSPNLLSIFQYNSIACIPGDGLHDPSYSAMWCDCIQNHTQDCFACTRGKYRNISAARARGGSRWLPSIASSPVSRTPRRQLQHPLLQSQHRLSLSPSRILSHRRGKGTMNPLPVFFQTAPVPQSLLTFAPDLTGAALPLGFRSRSNRCCAPLSFRSRSH